MSDKSRFNNTIITISVLLNVVLTVLLIILLGQTGTGKDDTAEISDTGHSSYYDDESVFVLQSDDMGVMLDGEEVTEAAPTQTQAPPPTTASTTAETTTTAATTTAETTTTAPTETSSSAAETTASSAESSTAPTLPTAGDDSEDSGDWLDIWGM